MLNVHTRNSNSIHIVLLNTYQTKNKLKNFITIEQLTDKMFKDIKI